MCFKKDFVCLCTNLLVITTLMMFRVFHLLDSILNPQEDGIFLQIQRSPFLFHLKSNCYRFLKVSYHRDNHMDLCSLDACSSGHRVGGFSHNRGLYSATCFDCSDTKIVLGSDHAVFSFSYHSLLHNDFLIFDFHCVYC